MTFMNVKAVGLQATIFSVQWVLMLFGFGIISQYIAPARILGTDLLWGGYVDAGLKALAALAMSVAWLVLWDRQVRWLFYRR